MRSSSSEILFQKKYDLEERIKSKSPKDQISVIEEKSAIISDFLKNNLNHEFQETKNDSFEKICENVFDQNIYNQINFECQSNSNKQNYTKNEVVSSPNNPLNHPFSKYNIKKINRLFKNCVSMQDNMQEITKVNTESFTIFPMKNKCLCNLPSFCGILKNNLQIKNNDNYKKTYFLPKSKSKIDHETWSIKINENLNQNGIYKLKIKSKTNFSTNFGVQGQAQPENKKINILKSENINNKDNKKIKIDTERKFGFVSVTKLKRYQTDKLTNKKNNDFWNDKV